MRICNSFHDDGTVENGSIAGKRKRGNGISDIVRYSLRKKGEIAKSVVLTHVDMRGDIDFSKSRGACVKENVNGI